MSHEHLMTPGDPPDGSAEDLIAHPWKTSPVTPAALADAMQRALEGTDAIAPGHGHLIIEAAIGGQVRALLATKINDTWSVAGEVAWSTASAKPEGYVAIRASW